MSYTATLPHFSHFILLRSPCESSYSDHLFKCFSDGDGGCTFEEVNFQTDLKKTKVTLIEIHTVSLSRRLVSWAEWTKPHELLAAFIYIRFPHISLLRWCLLPSLRELLVRDSWLTGRNLKDNLNISVICWEIGLISLYSLEELVCVCLSVCDRSQTLNPGWFTASSSCYQYWFISKYVSLYSNWKPTGSRVWPIIPLLTRE